MLIGCLRLTAVRQQDFFEINAGKLKTVSTSYTIQKSVAKFKQDHKKGQGALAHYEYKKDIHSKA